MSARRVNRLQRGGDTQRGKPRQIGAIEATLAAENAWVDHVNDVAHASIYPTCNSWYLGANVPGKPRVFMPYLGVPAYVEKCNQVAAGGYGGFETVPIAS